MSSVLTMSGRKLWSQKIVIAILAITFAELERYTNQSRKSWCRRSFIHVLLEMHPYKHVKSVPCCKDGIGPYLFPLVIRIFPTDVTCLLFSQDRLRITCITMFFQWPFLTKCQLIWVANKKLELNGRDFYWHQSLVISRVAELA